MTVKEKKLSRPERTKKKIWEAYLGLLKEKESDDITVKDICASAGINRSTYYAYYFDLHDLLAEKEAELNETILSRLSSAASGSVGVRADLFAYLAFVKENAGMFYACFKIGGRDCFPVEMRNGMRRSIAHYYRLNSQSSETVRSLILDFYEEGIYRVIKNWVLCGCTETEGEIFSVIYGCMTGFSSDKKD